MKIGYMRISLQEYVEGICSETLKSIADKIFVDEIIEKNLSRVELEKAFEVADEGDFVVVESFATFARNTRDLLQLLQIIKEKKLEFISLKEKIDTSTPEGKHILAIFTSFSELEKNYMKQRQREGIDDVLGKGKNYGRPRILTPEKITEAYNYFSDTSRTEETKTIYEKLGVSKATFYKLMREEKQRLTKEKDKAEIDMRINQDNKIKEVLKSAIITGSTFRKLNKK